MVKRWLELGLSGIKSTHTRTHTHTLINPKPLIPNPNRRVTHEGSPCGGSACGWCVGVPVRLAPWTSHLEGNFCAFWPANSGSHEREPQLNWHIQSILICQQKKKNLWPATLEWERKKKKKRGWFLQVIYFLSQNNWKIHPWMCCPESFQSLIR